MSLVPNWSILRNIEESVPSFLINLQGKKMSVNISDVLDIVSSQNPWSGKEAINLIASENVQSDAVKQIESNEFIGRMQKDTQILNSKTADQLQHAAW